MRPGSHGARIGALVGSVGLVTALVVPGGGSASAAPRANRGRERVIVVLTDQLASTPASKAHISARAARALQEQDAVLARLAGPAPARVTHFAVGNAFSASVTTDQAAALAGDPAVASVGKDASIPVDPAPAPTPAGSAATSAGGARANDANSSFTVCPTDPGQPLVEPEALESIHALTSDGSPNAQELSTGAGVKVAFIADGIDPDNPDFISPGGEQVIVDYQDFSGEGPDAPSNGTEAFGDASSIAAQGTVIHDLSSFVNQAYPLPAGCTIRIVGVAPDARIVALKAGGASLTTSAVLQSIDYAVRVAHVDVLNESFGTGQFPDASSRNAIELFNDAAVAAGVTVTMSTGDGGVNGTIGGAAPDPNVIAVGATTDSRLYAQTGYAGARAFGNGAWISDNISALSSAGVSQFGRTDDLVAPGEGNWAVCEPAFSGCLNFRSPPGPSDIQSFSGTSESAPLTAGVAALVISAYRSTHEGATPTPAVVKQIITGTATDLGVPTSEQGAGLLNARAATEAALTWPGATTATDPSVASHIVTSTDQMTLTGTPGSTKQGKFTVTNVGTEAQTVAVGTRGEQVLAETGQATAFDSNTLPSFPYSDGQSWAFKKLTFHVPSGGARLVAQTAWAGSQPPADKILRLSLFAPDGSIAANSRPQGGTATANYATVDVRNPAPGTWTALLYSVAGSAGYTGVVGLLTTTQGAVAVGSVQPPVFTLNPGESRVVTTHFTVPSTSTGDQTYAVTLATSSGQQTVVAAVVRTLIDTTGGHGTFKGLVTGGNARPGVPGETFSYQFSVPAATPELTADVQFPHNPESVVDLVLIDPNGEVADVVSNLTPNRFGTNLTLKRAMQSFTADPVPGRWTLVVVAQNPVSGTAFSEPFHGDLTFDPPAVDRGGLPDDDATTLTAGTPAQYTVSLTNPGVQTLLVGVDPRLRKTVTLQPVPIQGQSTFALPATPGAQPIYAIPPDTSSLTVAASSTTPAQVTLFGPAGGFTVAGDLAAAQSGNLISTASVSESGGRSFITRGAWFTDVQEIGPFTDAGQTAGSTTLTASMRTYAFDTDVTSHTGDPYGNSIDPNNNGFGHPVFIKPGQTKTIVVTITPSAAVGTTVSGVLNLVTVATSPAGFTSAPSLTTGSVVAALPYQYTVG